MTIKDKMLEINNVENKYGLMLFRMGLVHLFDDGHRHLSDEAHVKECTQQIIAQGEADKANGVHPVITPEYLCEVVRCAAELTQFSPMTLFEYIQKHVVVCNDSIKKYLLISRVDNEFEVPELFDSLDEAYDAMKTEYVHAMGSVSSSIGDEHGLNISSAWFNHQEGNYDWKIFKLTHSGKLQNI